MFQYHHQACQVVDYKSVFHYFAITLKQAQGL